jgi:sugar diacid utilization regulator
MRGPNLALVIDADVARSAGPDPKERPWSDRAKYAHDILAEIRNRKSYRLVFDHVLKKEWDKHQGNTAKKLFADMISSRRIDIIREPQGQWLDTLIANLPRKDQATASKDRHLIILACDHGDKRLFSQDNAAREKYARISDERLETVHWVEPSYKTKKWLRDGAPKRKELMLGF